MSYASNYKKESNYNGFRPANNGQRATNRRGYRSKQFNKRSGAGHGKRPSDGKWKTSKDGVEYIQGWFFRKWTGLVVVTSFIAKNAVERTGRSGKAFISYSAIVENKTACTKSNYPAWYCKADGCLYISGLNLIVNTKKGYTKPMFKM